MDNISVSSGVSSIVMNIYRNINKKYIQFDFLVSNRTSQSYENEIKKLGGRIFYSGNPLSFKTIVSACKFNKDFFKKHKDDYVAVHLHSPTICEMTVKYAKKYGVRNIIIHSHSSMFSKNIIKKNINKILKLNLTKYGNLFFACSTEAAIFLYGRNFCKNNRVEIIKNGVDPAKFEFKENVRRDIRNKNNRNDKSVVAHVSNFSPIKNVEFLIPVIEDVSTTNKNILFLFIGDGPTRSKLERTLKDNNLIDYCVFLGSIDNVNYYLNAVDFLLLPSIKEGLPVCVVEAQANGLPCFVSESVTREVKVKNVEFLKLDKKLWSNKILDANVLQEEERKQNSLSFKESEFNIFHEVSSLEKYYLNLKK